MLNYNLDVIFFLVPNCPFYYVGAKLSWCQIVRCQIVRFYYVGAKLSWCQIVRVPNCPAQIVLVPNCPVPNCQVPNCPTTPKSAWGGPNLILRTGLQGVSKASEMATQSQLNLIRFCPVQSWLFQEGPMRSVANGQTRVQ